MAFIHHAPRHKHVNGSTVPSAASQHFPRKPLSGIIAHCYSPSKALSSTCQMTRQGLKASLGIKVCRYQSLLFMCFNFLFAP